MVFVACSIATFAYAQYDDAMHSTDTCAHMRWCRVRVVCARIVVENLLMRLACAHITCEDGARINDENAQDQQCAMRRTHVRSTSDTTSCSTKPMLSNRIAKCVVLMQFAAFYAQDNSTMLHCYNAINAHALINGVVMIVALNSTMMTRCNCITSKNVVIYAPHIPKHLPTTNCSSEVLKKSRTHVLSALNNCTRQHVSTNTSTRLRTKAMLVSSA